MHVAVKTSFVVFLLYACSASANASDEESQLELYIEQQKIALEVELNRLAVELDLDTEKFDEIRTSVAPSLKNGAQSLGPHLSVNDKGACKRYRGVLARELADAIHAKARDFVDREKLKKYRKDYEKVIEWEDRYAQRYLLVFLDGYFRFSSEQFSELERRFADSWNSVWNFKAVSVPFEGYKVCKPVLDVLENDQACPRQFSKLLTEKQLSIFKRLDKLALNYVKFISLKPEEDFELIKPQLPCFVDRTIEELSEFVDLNDKARVRLRVGYKGTVISLAKTRKAANLAYGKKSDLWHMSAFMKSSHQQMREEPIWKSTVAGALTDEQMATYLANEKRHLDARYDVGVAFGILYLHRGRRLRYNELMELHRQAVEKVIREGETNLYRSTFVLFALPDEFFASIFEPDTMKAIESQLSQARLWKRE